MPGSNPDELHWSTMAFNVIHCMIGANMRQKPHQALLNRMNACFVKKWSKRNLSGLVFLRGLYE
jgi:hypothetical protein